MRYSNFIIHQGFIPYFKINGYNLSLWQNKIVKFENCWQHNKNIKYCNNHKFYKLFNELKMNLICTHKENKTLYYYDMYKDIVSYPKKENNIIFKYFKFCDGEHN